MIKKNHHYIPVFYQKLFSNNTKSIGKFLSASKKYIPHSSIRKTGVIEYLYGEDQFIEDMFMKIETKAGAIIQRILKSGKIPDRNTEDYEILMLFVITLEARVQKQADATNRFVDVQMKTILKMKIDHGQIDYNPEDLERVNIGYDIPNLPQIKVATQIYRIIADLKCCLIISDTDREFITSDNPVVRYNFMYRIRNYHMRNYGLGNKGIQLFIPLSPKVCLYYFDDVMYDYPLSEDGNIHIDKSRYVDKLNKLFYMNSFEFILFNNNVKERYIQKIIKGKSNLFEVEDLFILGSKDNKLIGHGFKSVKEYINLPFFKVRKELLDMPLPMHMAGPIRPHAKKFNAEKNGQNIS